MARARPDPSPVDLFLAPVAALARRNPAIEGLVFWHQDSWPAQPTEALESEEVAFYAEGLVDEGFHLEWRIMALDTAPDAADHIALFVWQEQAPRPPAPGPGWRVLAQAGWPA